MLRQLARLTRPLPSAGADALAVAVYGDPSDEPVVARESGFEGVACVDDAARLLDLLCDLWTRAPGLALERWARGVLEFVLWMQVPDGRWLNFVYDWRGTRNQAGITSSTGENFWHARALAGVSNAWLTFGEERALAALHRGLDHAVTRPAPSDVRAVHLLVGLRLLEHDGFGGMAPTLRRWARDIAGCRIGDRLMNNPDERGDPHLWAHVQEGALAEAGRVLGDDDLVDVAVSSARAVWEPVVRGGFDLPSVSPYDVACAIDCVDRLGRVDTGGPWTELATDARAWFDRVDGRGRAVYDRATGRVADGVDEGRVSENSGAEANIVAACSLIDDALTSVPDAVALLPSAPVG